MQALERCTYIICKDYCKDLAHLNIQCTADGHKEIAEIAQEAHVECVKLLIRMSMGYISPRECLETVQDIRNSAINRAAALFAETV